MAKTYESSRVVTVHCRHDERDRESGRVVGEMAGEILVRFTDGHVLAFQAGDLVVFGGARTMPEEPWAPGQAIVLLDSYPDRGVNAGQIARVVEVSLTGRCLEVRAKGQVPTNECWRTRVSDLSEMLRLDRVPLPTYHEIIEDMRRGWHRGWIKADRCYRIPT